MFVVRFKINNENTDYYFNSIRNARLLERHLLVIVYDDIEKMMQKSIVTYTFSQKIYKILNIQLVLIIIVIMKN